MNTTPLYIFDLDGTLADLKHRRHFVEYPYVECENCLHYHNERRCQLCNTKHPFKPNWDAFHAACVDDTPIDAIIDVLACVRHNESDVWIWSGRTSTVSAKTFRWLQDHHIRFNQLKMRLAGDHTPDDQLKESWLHAMSPEDRARLVMVFDDRQRVVDMWRRNGVVCAQVAPGDF